MANDNYKTDQWILDLFPNYFDPCPLNYEFDPDNDEDGLKINWNWNDYDGVFVNPPYSNPLPWVKKAISENRKANWQYDPCSEYYDEVKVRCGEYGSAENIVMLLKHDTSTQWYKLLHEAGAKFLMIQGRLKHGTGKSAAFPSVLAVLN